MASLSDRVSENEKLLKDLIYAQFQTERSIVNLSGEMKDFKDEMKDFKDEMKDFKDEMKDFKDGMKGSKDEIKEDLKEYKEFTQNILDGMNKRWGELANKMGTVVEDIIAPGIKTLLDTYFKCNDFQEFSVNTLRRSKTTGNVKEFDVVVICGDRILVNETKTTVRKGDIEEFYEFIQSGQLTDYFSGIADKKVVPIISTLRFTNRNIVEQLTKRKIYAAQLKGGQFRNHK